MAYTKLKMIPKTGKKYYECQFSRGRGKGYITRRFYPEPTWSDKYAKRELAKFVADIQRQIESGDIVSRKEEKERQAAAKEELLKLKTVRGYITDVFMPTKTITVSENTRASYQSNIDHHILPYIGDYMMVEVTPALIQKTLTDFQKAGHAHESCVKLYNILNGIFDMANRDDTVPCNPMEKVNRPAQNKDAKKPSEADKALTVEQLGYLLKCLSEAPLKWQTYIQLAIDLGARRGELVGLKWTDIDFDNQTVTICRNVGYTPQKGVFFNNPKNGKAREVDLGPESIELLKKLRQEQASTCMSEYVFTQDGQTSVMHPDSPTRYFAKFGKKYGIENFHPHLLRHTSASVAITHGADVVSVSARLGHSDPAVTLRMYSHANKESIRRSGQIIRDALKAVANGQ